jgi:hypothetical protein
MLQTPKSRTDTGTPGAPMHFDCSLLSRLGAGLDGFGRGTDVEQLQGRKPRLGRPTLEVNTSASDMLFGMKCSSIATVPKILSWLLAWMIARGRRAVGDRCPFSHPTQSPLSSNRFSSKFGHYLGVMSKFATIRSEPIIQQRTATALPPQDGDFSEFLRSSPAQ